jgi:hypothetical protein
MKKELMRIRKIKCLDMLNEPLLLLQEKEKEDEVKKLNNETAVQESSDSYRDNDAEQRINVCNKINKKATTPHVRTSKHKNILYTQYQ